MLVNRADYFIRVWPRVRQDWSSRREGSVSKCVARMIFKRRDREHWRRRMRVYFLPRRNYSRSFRYYWKRMLRIKATPHAIAAGVAAGAFASFTPFMGFHFILAFVSPGCSPAT
jgi:hypothetical protein